MAKRKRTALDEEIARAQKNTRNKLYRLRRKGATNTAELDPRLPMAERRNMNGSQKRKYLRELQEFNSRPNRIFVQANNVAVPYQDLVEFRIQEARANVARAFLRQNIEKNIPEQIKSKELTRDVVQDAYMSMRISEDKEFYLPKTNKFQDIQPIVKTVPFSSVKALRKGLRGAEISEEKVKSNHKRYRSYKKGLAAKLEEHGYDDLAKQIKTLTYAQMDYLHYYTDFDEEMNLFRYTRELDEGLSQVAESTLENAYDYASQMVSAAKQISRRLKY